MKIKFPSGNEREILVLTKSDRQKSTGAPATRPRRTGLGDWTERMLSKAGVTQERYAAAKEMFGMAPTCNCAKRKEWLNKVSDWWRGESAE